jgi:uncharacterized protein YciI
MIFAVIFEDNPGKEELRQMHMSKHLAFLETQTGVLGAGPMLSADGTGHGGMWLIEANSAKEVEEMVRNDPFHETGLRKSITILEWRQVVRDGQRLG